MTSMTSQETGREWVERAARGCLDVIGALRFETVQERIVDRLMTDGPLTSAALLKTLDTWAGPLHVALIKLEQSGRIASDWVPGRYPRRRRYWIAEALDSE